MRIKEILHQNRRDFTAIFECEHCGETENPRGYDDAYFHQAVIPEIKCPKCGSKAPKDYIPRATKYEDWEVV